MNERGREIQQLEALWRRPVPPPELGDVLRRAHRVGPLEGSSVPFRWAGAAGLTALVVLVLIPSIAIRKPVREAFTPSVLAHAMANPFSARTPASVLGSVFSDRTRRSENPFRSARAAGVVRDAGLPTVPFTELWSVATLNPFQTTGDDHNPFTPDGGESLLASGMDTWR